MGAVAVQASERVVGHDQPIMDIEARDRFHLEPTFLDTYRGKQPEWGPVGFVTYKRTYARPIGKESAVEEFWQTLQRVTEGVYTVQKWHCRKNNLHWRDGKAQRSAQRMFKLMWEFKFLPGGRGLWMMGTEYVEVRGSAALNNCAFVSTDEIAQDFAEPFCFLMDFSMLGVGVGSDCKGAGKVTIQRPVQGDDVHVVADTREGWVELARRHLNAYVGVGSLPASIDTSAIRPYGAPIKSFGGTAAGPEPLLRLVREIRRVLDKLVGFPITSEAIVDIFDLIGVCVVAGNVRRSAIIMFGEADDAGFLNLKNPEIAKDAMNTHRWASNNSIRAKIGMDYGPAAAILAKAGEPGFLWLENAQHQGRIGEKMDDTRAVGTNPCGEIILEPYELCNLVETFPSRHATYEDYRFTLKFAYLYAKVVSLIPTHNKRTNAVTMRNRRIGISQSGIIQSFTRHGRRTHFEWCKKGYDYLAHLDHQYSEWLCVRHSKRRTTVKPSGTVSLLPGVTPGIHYEHAEYYYRTIRVAKSSPLIAAYQKAGYRIEDDVYDKSGKTSVIYFPIKADYFDRGKTDVSLWEQLENAAQMQQFWSDNSVSVTVTFKPEEVRDISRALELYEARLKTVSLLPLEEHGYAQAPYITIDAAEYEKAVSQLREVDISNATHEETVKYCDGDVCTIAKPKTTKLAI